MNQKTDTAAIVTLDLLAKGASAVITRIDASTADNCGLAREELERRLMESGFVEGMRVTVVHEAPIGRDPMAVVIAPDTIVALRRCEARAVHVEKS